MNLLMIGFKSVYWIFVLNMSHRSGFFFLVFVTWEDTESENMDLTIPELLNMSNAILIACNSAE